MTSSLEPDCLALLGAHFVDARLGVGEGHRACVPPCPTAALTSSCLESDIVVVHTIEATEPDIARGIHSTSSQLE